MRTFTLKPVFQKTFLLFCVMAVLQLVSLRVYAQGDIDFAQPEKITGTLIRVTEPISNFSASKSLVQDIKVRDISGIIGSKKLPVPMPFYPEQEKVTSDEAVQRALAAPSLNAPVIGANFDGMDFTSVAPADPTVCAGPNHVLQMINGSSGAYFKVYNKTGGQVVAQTYMDNITGRGGLGDPIAMYDHIADRFVITEFANRTENANQEGLIIAVSQTNNPAGAWYVYFFGFGTNFPDFPKYGIWPDGYYCTINEFANAASYNGSSIIAFNRTQMLAGGPTATAIRVKFNTTSWTKYFAMIPVSVQGNDLSAAGSGGLISYMADDTWTASTTDVDSIGLIQFKPDYTTPANSVLTNLPPMAVTPFKWDICTAARGRCITQPGTAIALEALNGRVQNVPIYRNFGSHEGIVLSFPVDKGGNISALRWYELRRSASATAPGDWSIYQQSTYSPDNTHRWLPSICYDKFGNIAMAYNVSSGVNNVFPGIRFTGRKECDPLNTMTYAEQSIIEGTVAGTAIFNRYGDYNHLVAEPDGSGFWFTGMYNKAATWSTRIASFKLDQCAAPVLPTLSISGVTVNESAGNAVLNICLSAPSSSNVTVQYATANGSAIAGSDYTTKSATATITAGQTCTSVSIPIINDNVNEQTENFTVNLSNPTNATILNGTGTVTINDDDPVTTGCSTVTITPGSGSITIGGITSPYSYIKISNSVNWQTVFSQFYTTNPGVVTVPSLPTGSYYVQVYFYTTEWSLICTKEETVNVTGAASPCSSLVIATTSNSIQINNITTTHLQVNLFNSNWQSVFARTYTSNPGSVTIPALAAGTYYLQVYMYTPNWTVLLCSKEAFYTVGGNGSMPEANQRGGYTGNFRKLLTMPNPFTNQLVVTAETDKDERLSLVLMDIQGRQLISRNTQMRKGTNVVTMDGLQQLPAGTYFLRVITDDKLKLIKVLKR